MYDLKKGCVIIGQSFFVYYGLIFFCSGTSDSPLLSVSSTGMHSAGDSVSPYFNLVVPINNFVAVPSNNIEK